MHVNGGGPWQPGEAAAADIRRFAAEVSGGGGGGGGGGADVVVRRLDLTDADSIDELHRYVAAELGRLDVLVNNAAVCFNDSTLYGRGQPSVPIHNIPHTRSKAAFKRNPSVPSFSPPSSDV